MRGHAKRGAAGRERAAVGPGSRAASRAVGVLARRVSAVIAGACPGRAPRSHNVGYSIDLVQCGVKECDWGARRVLKIASCASTNGVAGLRGWGGRWGLTLSMQYWFGSLAECRLGVGSSGRSRIAGRLSYRLSPGDWGHSREAAFISFCLELQWDASYQ